MEILKADPELIEAVPVLDIYCDELSLIELCGPNARFIFTTRQTLHAGRERQTVRQIALKLVMPIAQVEPAIVMTRETLGAKLWQRIRAITSRLH